MISMCSYFSPWSAAGEQRHDCVGRPGLNPLRYETQYVVDAQAIKDLKRISEMLGLEAVKEGRAKFGMFWGKVPDTDTVFHFLNTDFVGKNYNKFVVGDKQGINTSANGIDAKENIRWIKEARRQADWVFVALHSHEADGDKHIPARFIQPFAKECIDAGADAVIGSGPHVLRGVEIYKGKPIFYSLGNFIWHVETLGMQPAEFYERYELNPEYMSMEAWDVLTKNGTCGFAIDQSYWESALAKFTFQESKLNEVRLFPVTLGFGKHRAHNGLPLLADENQGRVIIERIIKLSEPYGTKIDLRDGVGLVKL